MQQETRIGAIMIDSPQLIPHAAALRLLGASVAPARERTFHGVPVALGPAVVLAPSFCPCLSELRPKLPSPAQVSSS